MTTIHPGRLVVVAPTGRIRQVLQVDLEQAPTVVAGTVTTTRRARVAAPARTGKTLADRQVGPVPVLTGHTRILRDRLVGLGWDIAR